MKTHTKKSYEIRDPVHGSISFNDFEKRIIDHPYVQRLRFIHQLGFVFFVYPGATHDRFSHALGAMHVAGLLWNQIAATSADVLLRSMTRSDIEYLGRVIRLAGLLHDSGHGPFSHTSEGLLPKLASLEVPHEWYKTPIVKSEQAGHEDYSIMVIAALAKGNHAVLKRAEAQDIASLVHHRIRPSPEWEKRFARARRNGFHVHDVVQNLISGELDCDRMDYLMRDAHHTGVPYGFYDIDRLISSLSLAVLPNKRVHLTLNYTGIRAFEDFLLARYHMLLQVYFHKTANCFDYFLETAFTSGELEYAIPSTMEEFAHLRDSMIFEKLFEAAKNPKNVFCRELVARRPATLVFSSSMLHHARDGVDGRKRIIKKITAICKKKNVTPIIVSSAQHLYRSHAKGKEPQLYAVKRVMEEPFYESIEKYSNLLQKYNEEINLVDVYILKRDYPKVSKALKRFLVTEHNRMLGVSLTA